MSGILKVFGCPDNSRFALLNIQLEYLLGIAAFLVHTENAQAYLIMPWDRKPNKTTSLNSSRLSGS